jgi:hypothetical protein
MCALLVVREGGGVLGRSICEIIGVLKAAFWLERTQQGFEKLLMELA